MAAAAIAIPAQRDTIRVLVMLMVRIPFVGLFTILVYYLGFQEFVTIYAKSARYSPSSSYQQEITRQLSLPDSGTPYFHSLLSTEKTSYEI